MQGILFAIILIGVTAIPFFTWVYWLDRKLEHEKAEEEKATRQAEALKNAMPTTEELLLQEVRDLHEDMLELLQVLKDSSGQEQTITMHNNK